MCGIFGNYSFSLGNVSDAEFLAVGASLRHRGPDATGIFVTPRAAIGNTRLSIMDLSVASNQPFFSDDGDIALVQNGEIYNYIELRDELRRRGCRFSTSGDTEVLLRAFEIWGHEFVTRLNGMFAIAIYVRTRDELWLYRDRLGVKPLYYCGSAQEGKLWFGSEIKTLLAAGYPATPNYDAISQFFALNYIPQPSTAFLGIHHLPPAHYAKITPQGMDLFPYWSLASSKPVPDMTEGEAKAGLLTLLDDATRLRMRSDAQFGAFLSGGLDSSSVVGFMSMYQKNPVRTFSIGFRGSVYDETYFARLASQRFGTLHEVQYMEPDIATLWPRFIWHVDQPHGDVSFLPMDHVSSLAAREVKMVLTGDGGDELFAGYEKYADFFLQGSVNDQDKDWEDRFARTAGLLNGGEAEGLLTGPLRAAFMGSDPYRSLSSAIRSASGQDPINRVLFAETTVLLPGNNLVKPDRMAMANSLEVRSPFLDYRMAEFAFLIPGKHKLAGGVTKAILKKAVQPLLGSDLTYRKKQMFTVPVGDWFRTSLADYCRNVLLDGRLDRRGIVNSAFVAAMLEEHVSGRSNFTRQLRALISVELWFRLFIDRDDDLRALAQRPLVLI